MTQINEQDKKIAETDMDSEISFLPAHFRDEINQEIEEEDESAPPPPKRPPTRIEEGGGME